MGDLPEEQREGARNPLRNLYSAHREAKHPASEVWQHWMDLIRHRVKNDYDVVILVTGDEGSGKSALAQTAARDVDPTFASAAGRVCYTTQELLTFLHGARRGQACVFDEAVMGSLSQDRYSDETRDLVRTIQVVRSIGAVVFLCLPQVWEASTTFRARRAELLWYCQYEPRGFATVHQREHRLDYKRPGNVLGLWIDRTWNPLQWPDPSGEEWWQAYRAESDRRKRTIVGDASKAAQVSERKAGVNVTCHYCGHLWRHKGPGGPLARPQCPSCGKRTYVQEEKNVPAPAAPGPPGAVRAPAPTPRQRVPPQRAGVDR